MKKWNYRKKKLYCGLFVFATCSSIIAGSLVHSQSTSYKGQNFSKIKPKLRFVIEDVDLRDALPAATDIIVPTVKIPEGAKPIIHTTKLLSDSSSNNISANHKFRIINNLQTLLFKIKNIFSIFS